MDEDDIREQEESQQLSTDRGFEGFGTADDANHRDALMDLFRPSETSIGEKLLNKMGWKQGQGIGPKTRRRVEPSDDASEVHLFAPDDTQMIVLTKKNDCKGLGFNRDTKFDLSTTRAGKPDQLHVSAESDGEDEERPGLSFAMLKRNSSKPKRGAFGVGILNDTGSDDEDPYSVGPKISYNKTLGREKKSKSAISLRNNANPLLKNKPVFVPQKLATISSTLRKCHDGRLPLDGFVLADNLDIFSALSLNDEKYKPPSVPENWQPMRMSSMDLSTNQATYESTAEAARSSNLDSSSRGTILGESTLPGKSVFDYLTPVAREKLMKASGKINLPPALSESLPSTSSLSSRPDDVRIPQIDPRTALQALSRTLNSGFTPYASDPDKAARYKTYLEHQADSSTNSLPTPPPALSPTDYQIELHEFARAAEVFKPVSGLMASRFTTSTTTGGAQSPAPTDSSPEALLSKPTSKPKDPAEEAARMGMFGHLTRSVTNFYPTRLLCKRFGVDMPMNTELPQDSRAAKTNVNLDVDVRMDTLGKSLGQRHLGSVGYQHGGDKAGLGTDAKSASRQLAIKGSDGNVVHAQADPPPPQLADFLVDPERNEALEQEKPGAAVFKAIFGSDDEDEDEDD